MKRWQIILRKIMLVALSATGVGVFIMLLTSAVKKQEEIFCNGMQIHVDYNSGLSFISKDEVAEKIMFVAGDSVHLKKLSSLPLRKIETLLEKQPYIDSAEVFFNQQRQLIINVKQKRPILRIINSDGVGYYLSDKAETMPLSNSFTPRVPVALGYVQNYADSKRDSCLKAGLWKLIIEMEKDTFMQALTDHVNVLENGEIELIPVLGNFNILFGKPHVKTSEKIGRIKTFYHEALPRTGWEKYKTLNVKFENQVVAVKRDSTNITQSTATNVSTAQQ